LIYFVQYYPISAFDLYLTREIQQQSGAAITFLMTFISIFYGPLTAPVSIAVAALFFVLTHHRREAWFTLSVILPDVFNILLKLAIHRPRPTLAEAKILLTFTQSSFPSGHVVHYVVFFGFLLTVMLVNKTISPVLRLFIGILSAFLILSVSVSRIFLGAHWATDVIGGYLFGIVYLGIILTFYLKKSTIPHP